jgi:plastocyanin
MWVASDPHPIHNGYDGTTVQQHCAAGYAGPAPFDECAAGTSFTFTFDKVGTWGYHDHLDHSVMGTITVVAQ